MIQALIFDFDGLILDTEQSEFQAWQEVYAEHSARQNIGHYALSFNDIFLRHAHDDDRSRIVFATGRQTSGQ